VQCNKAANPKEAPIPNKQAGFVKCEAEKGDENVPKWNPAAMDCRFGTRHIDFSRENA